MILKCFASFCSNKPYLDNSKMVGNSQTFKKRIAKSVCRHWAQKPFKVLFRILLD